MQNNEVINENNAFKNDVLDSGHRQCDDWRQIKVKYLYRIIITVGIRQS